MQYKGPDFRERIGGDWPQEELGFYRSEGIGPSGRDITTAGSGDVKSCHHKGLDQREGLCRAVAGGILIQEAGTCLVPLRALLVWRKGNIPLHQADLVLQW